MPNPGGDAFISGGTRWARPRDAVQAAQTEAAVSHLETNIKNGASLKERIRKAWWPPSQVITERRAVNPREEASNMSYFYAMEGDAGVVEVNASPKGASKALPGKTFVTVAYALDERGDFRHLVNFVRRIERGRNFSHILSATIVNSSTQDQAETILTLDLSVNLLECPAMIKLPRFLLPVALAWILPVEMAAEDAAPRPPPPLPSNLGASKPAQGRSRRDRAKARANPGGRRSPAARRFEKMPFESAGFKSPSRPPPTSQPKAPVRPAPPPGGRPCRWRPEAARLTLPIAAQARPG